jgi:hypothetical protein
MCAHTLSQDLLTRPFRKIAPKDTALSSVSSRGNGPTTIFLKYFADDSIHVG